MAYLKMTVRSEVLGREDDVAVILPESYDRETFLDKPAAPGKKYQTLWLVHGGHGYCSEFMRYSQIELFASEKGIAVVMPTVRQTHRRNFAGRGDYFQYIGYELREILCGLLPLSAEPEDNFIVGQSFGGYFSWHLVLNHPDRFGAVGSFFSPLDCIVDDYRKLKTVKDPSVVGDPEVRRGTDYHFPGYIQELWQKGVKLPKMFQICGTEDMTYTCQLSFLDAVRKTGYDHTWIQDSGFHTMDFVQHHLKELFDWLPCEANAAKKEESVHGED